MNPLSEESKKWLTEFLEERWLSNQECIDSYASNREFSPDDWQSFGDLKNKLVEKSLWYGENGFERFILNWWNDNTDRIQGFTDWLINPAIFIPLVDEFLKEKETTEQDLLEDAS